MIVNIRIQFYKLTRSGMLRMGMSTVVLLVVCSLQAQQLPKGEALTMEEGLSFRDVTGITQDDAGLMWFSTKQGLNRYDGYRFIRFGEEKQSDQFFPVDEISAVVISATSDSILWIIAKEKLYTLNRNNFQYEEVTHRLGLIDGVSLLHTNTKGDLWASCYDDTHQYLFMRNPDGKFDEIARVPSLKLGFTSLTSDPAGNIWWSTTTAGLQQYTPQGKLVHESKPDTYNWYGRTLHYTPVYIDSRNRIIILPKSKNQVWLYHPSGKRVEVLTNQLASVATSCLEDRLGNIWITTNSQLFRWSADGVWTDFSKVLKDALHFTEVRGLYEDQTSLLWVATNNGLIKLPIQKQLFQTRFDQPGEGWGNSMRAIFEDNDGRVYSYCDQGNKGLHWTNASGAQFYHAFKSNMYGLVYNFLEGANHFIYDDSDHSVWTLTNQLLKIDLTNMVVTDVANFDDIVNKHSRNPLCRLSDGSFLLGQSLALLTVYNSISGERTKFLKDIDTKYVSIETNCILQNKDESIWIGTTNDGLYLMDKDGRILRHVHKSSSPAISNNNILALHQGENDDVWIGTFGGGLNHLDITSGEVQSYTQQDGLPNNNITGILQDDLGNIWFSTYNGLSCYRQEDRTFQNFFEEDGLTNNEFNYNSFFKDHLGQLWFGGMNGLQFFNPSLILAQDPNPSLSFTGFSKYNRATDSLMTFTLSAQSVMPIHISPYDSYFQFTWTLPNYFKPDKNRYYVWLEGLEGDWAFIGNTPTIRYNKLPPGDYMLHIKGADSKGNWSVSELVVPIHVTPFFFRTWWFILGVVFVLAGIVYAFARYRLRRLLEMERMRTRIAGDLHDEVGSMLSGLAMQAEILELDQQKSDPARLRRLSEISRQTLSKMRDVVWSIDSRRDQVKNLLDRMREHAEEMLTPAEMTFQFELGDLPMEKKLPVDDRQHLFLFYKEAITNVVRHSGATNVIIRFGQFGDHFELSIQDNGNTATSSSFATGLGMQNLEMRAKKLGGTFLLNKEDGFKVGLNMKSL